MDETPAGNRFMGYMKSYWQNQFEGYTPTNVTILPFTDMKGSENDPDFSTDVKFYHHQISDELILPRGFHRSHEPVSSRCFIHAA
jgi:hypothetical protein